MGSIRGEKKMQKILWHCPFKKSIAQFIYSTLKNFDIKNKKKTFLVFFYFLYKCTLFNFLGLVLMAEIFWGISYWTNAWNLKKIPKSTHPTVYIPKNIY